jgi:Domain of Unknown Function (DUF1080)
MKIFLLFVGISVSLFACQSSQQQTNSGDTTQTAADSSKNMSTKDTGWISLFDGQSLKGWHTYGKGSVGSAWSVDSGAIHLSAPNNKKIYQTKGGGDIVTDDEFDNFDFVCDWKISKAGNSGIIFYVHEDTSKYKETWNTGPEMQVLDNAGHPDAKIPKHRAGDLYDLISCSQETVKPWGEWNHAEIKCVNGKLDLFLNGVNVVSTTLWDDNWKKLIAGSKFKDMPDFGTFKKGHIALQDHGNDVWYKNIMIKKL